MTIRVLWLKYRRSHLLYVPAPSVFAYFSELSMAGRGDCDCVIAITNTEKFGMYLLRFSSLVTTGTTCVYLVSGNLITIISAFVPLPWDIVKNVETVGPLNVLYLPQCEPIKCLIAVEEAPRSTGKDRLEMSLRFLAIVLYPE